MLTERDSSAFPVSGTTSIHEMIDQAARHHALDPALIRALIRVESSFNPRAVSPKGAKGLMQIMPETARDLGLRNPFNPEENLYAGCKYLRRLLDSYNGNLSFALAAYNAGPTVVNNYGGIPPYDETINYVRKVMTLYRGTGLAPTLKAYRDRNNRLVISNVPRRNRR